MNLKYQDNSKFVTAEKNQLKLTETFLYEYFNQLETLNLLSSRKLINVVTQFFDRRIWRLMSVKANLRELASINVITLKIDLNIDGRMLQNFFTVTILPNERKFNTKHWLYILI